MYIWHRFCFFKLKKYIYLYIKRMKNEKKCVFAFNVYSFFNWENFLCKYDNL